MTTAAQTAAECRRCHQTRPMKGRGLCSGCYESILDAGRIDEWPTLKVDRARQVAELLDQGLTYREIGRRLGCSKNAVSLAARRLRGGLPVTVPPGTHPPLGVAPSTPPCTGVDPVVFEVNRTNAAGIEAALAYCSRCPTETRDWCVDVAVRPFANRYTGVAGARLWSRGVEVPVAVTA